MKNITTEWTRLIFGFFKYCSNISNYEHYFLPDIIFRATIFSQLPRKLRTHDLMSSPGERRYQPHEDHTVIEHYGWRRWWSGSVNASQVLNDLITEKYRVAWVHPFSFVIEKPFEFAFTRKLDAELNYRNIFDIINQTKPFRNI